MKSKDLLKVSSSSWMWACSGPVVDAVGPAQGQQSSGLHRANTPFGGVELLLDLESAPRHQLLDFPVITRSITTPVMDEMGVA